MNALVVGGNSGIGLSIVCELIKRNFQKIYVVGKEEIDLDIVDNSIRGELCQKVIFYKKNFINEDFSIFEEINDINALFITVGFGRVALFEDLTEIEIQNLLKVNLEAVVMILKHYYNKINSSDDFYTSVMVSICSRIVSPFFSVYSAAKSGLRFFIEAINIELNAKGLKNRILEVSPGSIKGTSFNGEKTNITQINNFSKEVISRTLNRDELFIPSYDEVYKNVLERYFEDPIEFGLNSYQYKKESGRVSSKPQVVIGYLSGTFDLFHIGHLKLLERAKGECDYLIVSVHESGAWKGKETFIPYEERKAIVQSIKYVDEVVNDFIEDVDAWEIYKYNKLFVGSDYKGTERFNRYENMLKGKAEIVYFPYTQGTSSTQLRERLKNKD